MAKPKATSEPAPPPIIVKKVTIVAAGHHGGAWKVAYADFVTAMMAFFLLLWLLGATTEKQRKGIADYFTPTLVKLRQSGMGTGLLGGSSLTDADKYPHRAGQTGTKTLTIPRDTTGGPKEAAGAIKRFQHARDLLDRKLQTTPQLRRLASQVRMVDDVAGIRIDMVDDAKFSMFRLGTTILTPDAAALMKAIAEVARADPGGLAIRGHTDALPWRPNASFGGAAGNNWSLSAGRAEATRQALLDNGLSEDRFRRIEGVADREPLIPADPHDPRNRRISVTLLR